MSGLFLRPYTGNAFLRLADGRLADGRVALASESPSGGCYEIARALPTGIHKIGNLNGLVPRRGTRTQPGVLTPGTGPTAPRPVGAGDKEMLARIVAMLTRLINRFDRDEPPMRKGLAFPAFIRARYRARYRFVGFQKKSSAAAFVHVLPQRPAFDQQQSKLDNEHDDENEHDSGARSICSGTYQESVMANVFTTSFDERTSSRLRGDTPRVRWRPFQGASLGVNDSRG